MDYRRVPDNGGRVTGRGSCTISGVTTSIPEWEQVVEW